MNRFHSGPPSRPCNRNRWHQAQRKPVHPTPTGQARRMEWLRRGFLFGAYRSLPHGRRRNQKCGGDARGVNAEHRLQHERRACPGGFRGLHKDHVRRLAISTFREPNGSHFLSIRARRLPAARLFPAGSLVPFTTIYRCSIGTAIHLE